MIKMESKKAQGLSLNVVIIAALVLIVLVVLVVIFSGRTALFSKGTAEVQEQYSGQKCEIPGTGRVCAANSCPPGKIAMGDNLDCGSGWLCCQ